APDADRAVRLELRDLGELDGVHALDVGYLSGAVEVKRQAALVEVHVHALRRERGDKVLECTRGQGDRAITIDLSADPDGDSKLEIGGREPESRVFGHHQHIGQNGQRWPARYRPADNAKTSVKVFLQDGNAHTSFSLAVKRGP